MASFWKKFKTTEQLMLVLMSIILLGSLFKFGVYDLYSYNELKNKELKSLNDAIQTLQRKNDSLKSMKTLNKELLALKSGVDEWKEFNSFVDITKNELNISLGSKDKDSEINNKLINISIENNVIIKNFEVKIVEDKDKKNKYKEIEILGNGNYINTLNFLQYLELTSLNIYLKYFEYDNENNFKLTLSQKKDFKGEVK